MIEELLLLPLPLICLVSCEPRNILWETCLFFMEL